ncbi:MAG: ornithine carbamoyltransferase [Methanomicrobiaceae archaeon]|nr:ornithine carbamoyltransferase [Methanomicrobiaceae archaeon]
MKRDLLSILDLSKEELESLLNTAASLKASRAGGEPAPYLPGRTLGMIFEKASTRTRISFEVGMYELGGTALFLSSQDLQLGRGEEIRDTARVLSRYVSAIMIRAYRHGTIEDMARYATVPVINALSDREHPCQLLADILTLREHFGDTEGLTVAWVGDGNNVCNSLILSSALAGYTVRVAAPEGYLPPAALVEEAVARGGRVSIAATPRDAVRDADVIYTDTWISMGSENEQKERVSAFAGYTVDRDLVDGAADDAVVLHCLPAHRGEEITDDVMEGENSLIWDQAENRLHAQKALLVRLIGKQETRD